MHAHGHRLHSHPLELLIACFVRPAATSHTTHARRRRSRSRRPQSSESGVLSVSVGHKQCPRFKIRAANGGFISIFCLCRLTPSVFRLLLIVLQLYSVTLIQSGRHLPGNVVVSCCFPSSVSRYRCNGSGIRHVAPIKLTAHRMLELHISLMVVLFTPFLIIDVYEESRHTGIVSMVIILHCHSATHANFRGHAILLTTATFFFHIPLVDLGRSRKTSGNSNLLVSTHLDWCRARILRVCTTLYMLPYIVTNFDGSFFHAGENTLWFDILHQCLVRNFPSFTFLQIKSQARISSYNHTFLKGMTALQSCIPVGMFVHILITPEYFSLCIIIIWSFGSPTVTSTWS